MKGLNTPLKRVGFLVFVAGLLMSFFGIYQIADNAYRSSDILETWLEAVLFERRSFGRYPSAGYGAWIAIIGLLSSFLYDKVTYRLVGWIKSGSTAKAHEPAPPAQLHFKDGAAALEYICKYMDTALVENELTPCLVVATSRSKDSGSFAVINIPTDGGPKKSTAAFLSEDVPTEIAGKLCAAMIGPVNPSTGEPVFMLCAELEPTWSGGAWKVRRRF